MPAVPLIWEAPLFARNSFGVVTREMARAFLRRSEVDLTLVPSGPDEFDPSADTACAPLLAASSRHKPLGAAFRTGVRPVLVRLQFPLRPFPAPGASWVIYHPWEYSLVPRASVDILNRAAEVWTTSRFCADVFIRSGVRPGKIQIVPNGFDPEIFRPEGPRTALPTEKPFRFLFVGGTIFRKGVDLLLAAYGRAFTARDPVSLLIKDLGGQGIYPFEKGAALVEEFSRDPSHPEVRHLSGYRTDAEMAGLYRAGDVFVSSYRGEGFCLPALEAMACGRPVIVTRGGATDDFVSEACGWPIPAGTRPVGRTIFGSPVGEEAELLEPDADALAELLRSAFRDEAGRLARGRAAAAIAPAWTWDAAAAKAIGRCRILSGVAQA